MKTKILILLMSTLFLNCSNDDSSTQENINFNNEVDLVFKNSSNENLLSTLTNGYFPIQDIKLFYDINGIKTEVYDENLDLPRNLKLVESAQNIFLVIFTNSLNNKLISEENGVKIVENITYLELSESITDTIRTHSEIISGNFAITKIWYNEVPVWDTNDQKEIEIIK